MCIRDRSITVADQERRGTNALAVWGSKIVIGDEILFQLIREDDLTDELVEALADFPAGDRRVFHMDDGMLRAVQILSLIHI